MCCAYLRISRGGGNLELAPQGFRRYSHSEGEYPKESSLLLKLKAGLLRQKSRNDRFGFTLAEVLITLGIIGVVAAMTMPSLISKYNEKAWLTAFKRSYSILNQAYLRVYEDIGISRNWCDKKNAECSQVYFNLLSTYLSISEVWGYNLPQHLKRIKYRDLDGSAFSLFSNYYWFVLNDGAFVGISYDSEFNMPLMLVDTNGSKRPNQLGKDLFFITLNNRDDSPVLSGYSKWWLYDGVFCSTTNASGAWYKGGGCSLWVIATGNMDYLHRQIPLDEWKKNVQKLLVKSGSNSLN